MAQDSLLRHVVRPWFPRSFDTHYGGFLCDFDRKWQPCGPHRKRLEFQARQTLAAAELHIVYPDNPALRQAVDIGFGFLRDAMWDGHYGGWHALTDRAGTPLNLEIKHSHGMAYATQACLAVFAATGDRSALRLANDSLEWTDRYARDAVNHGYFGPLSRDGAPLLHPPGREEVDMVGTRFGLKDMNVNNDFYELFIYASAIEGSHALVGARLSEMREIILRHYAVQGQTCWHYFTPSWQPAGSECRPGTAVQTAARLIEDRAGPHFEEQLRAARHLLDWSMQSGWDSRRKALHYSIELGAPVQNAKNLQWWSQLELLKIAAYLTHVHPDDEQVRALRDQVATLVATELFDDRFGGSRNLVRAASDLRDRYMRTNGSAGRKGHEWKDSSHDARVLIRIAGLSKNILSGGPPRFQLGFQDSSIEA